MKYGSITKLAAAHLVTDINQGAIPALLPFLMSAHDLTYTTAATIVFATNISSSLVQPLFGHFADRISTPWLMPLGILLAGLGLGLAGVVPTYGLVLFVVAISGIGLAAFHPEGARFVHAVSGPQKALAMSIFSVGGQLGLAIGPILTALVVVCFGLHGTILLAIPFVVMSLIVARRHYSVGVPQPAATSGPSPVTDAPDAWMPFLRLTAAIFFRAFAFYGLNTFLPLYWIHVLHQSKVAGGASLTIFLAGGICGTLLGGRMGDRYGYRDVALVALCLSGILLPVFTLVRGVTAATLLLIPMGMAHFTSFSPMVVLGQKYLPNRIGLASGVTIGLVVSVGGVAAPVFGRLADVYSIQSTFMLMAFLPVAGACLVFTLPRRYRPAAQRQLSEIVN